jgi:hypothetical protein
MALFNQLGGGVVTEFIQEKGIFWRRLQETVYGNSVTGVARQR